MAVVTVGLDHSHSGTDVTALACLLEFVALNADQREELVGGAEAAVYHHLGCSRGKKGSGVLIIPVFIHNKYCFTVTFLL